MLSSWIFCPCEPSYTLGGPYSLVGERKVPILSIIRGSDQTILYAHGNTGDIGKNYQWLDKVSESLNVNIIALDYAGYGHHPIRHSSAKDCTLDILEVYNWLLLLGVYPSNIIVWGRSLGSAVAINLASQRLVGGLILQSAFTSILDIPHHWSLLSSITAKILKWMISEPFPNLQRVQKVNCPVYIFHGLDDELIHWSHGQALGSKCHKLWDICNFPGAGHKDLNVKHSTAIIQKIRDFLTVL